MPKEPYKVAIIISVPKTPKPLNYELKLMAELINFIILKTIHVHKYVQSNSSYEVALIHTAH